MQEFMAFLNDNSGVISVIITCVYTVATIVICGANIYSAKAAEAQTAEMRRQYEAEQRPLVSYQIILEHRTWYCLQFTNYGKRIAGHFKIELDESFINSIKNSPHYPWLAELKQKEIVLAIGQSHNVYLGGSEFRNNHHKQPIRGTFSYSDLSTGNTYCESFEIDFEKYATFFSVNSPIEDLHEDLNDSLGRIATAIENIKLEMPNHPGSTD